MENLDRRAFIGNALGTTGSLLLGASVRKGTEADMQNLKLVDERLASRSQEKDMSNLASESVLSKTLIVTGVGVGSILELSGIVYAAANEADISIEEKKEREASGLIKRNRLSRRTLLRRFGQTIQLGVYVYATKELADSFDASNALEEKEIDLRCGGAGRPDCVAGEEYGGRREYTLKTPTPVGVSN